MSTVENLPKKKLTTSAMIASIANEGQPTKSAPFGHALNALAKRILVWLVYLQTYLNIRIYISLQKKIQINFSKWVWLNSF